MTIKVTLVNFTFRTVSPILRLADDRRRVRPYITNEYERKRRRRRRLISQNFAHRRFRVARGTGQIYGDDKNGIFVSIMRLTVT